MSVALDDTTGLIRAIRTRLGTDCSWKLNMDRIADMHRPERAHIAVMHEPYLSYILDGRKTIESRFSRHRIAPYDQVAQGDIVLFKLVSGPVTAVARVADVAFYRLDPTAWAAIRDRFSAALCADERFWEDRRHACYATLMRIADTRAIEPLVIDKRDRRPWVALAPQAATDKLSQFDRRSVGTKSTEAQAVPNAGMARQVPTSGIATEISSSRQMQFRFL
jgi:hypothetical protein